MTGYESKRAAARDKLEDDDTQVYQDDALTIAYQSGYYDGKKAAAQEPTVLDITIDDDDALSYLRDMFVQSDGGLTPIRLLAGDGHSGRGLYVASADYPEEGAIKIANIATTPPAAQPAPLAAAQPAQEPFCMYWEDRWGCSHYVDPKEPHPVNAKPLYTGPPQRPWVDLTNDDIFAAVKDLYGTAESAFMGRIDDIATARAIEAASRSKNT
jgi:hypothetical protein